MWFTFINDEIGLQRVFGEWARHLHKEVLPASDWQRQAYPGCIRFACGRAEASCLHQYKPCLLRTDGDTGAQ